MKNLSVQNKLIAGFGFLIVLCLVVGLVGVWGTGKLSRNVTRLGGESLPALQEVFNLQRLQAEIRIGQGRLLNPVLPRAVRSQIADEMGQALDQASETLSALAASEDETIQASLAELQNNWQAWSEKVRAFIALSRKLDNLGIDNPQQIALEAEQAFGAYKSWAAKTSKIVLEQQPPEGNLASDQSRLGRWLQSLEVDNPEMLEARQLLAGQVETAYANFGNITDFLEIGEYDLANEVYMYEVLPSIVDVQAYLDRLMAPLKQALALFEELAALEENISQNEQARLKADLNSLVQNANRAATSNLQASAGIVKTTSSTIWFAVGVGGLIAIGLGLWLPRQIAPPLKRAGAMMTHLGEGDLRERLGFRQNDEIGTMGRAMDQMAEQLGKMVNGLRASAASLNDIIANVTKASDEVDQGAQHQAAEVEDSLRAIALINQNGDRIGEAVSNLSSAVTEGSSSTLEMSANIEEVASNMSQVAATIEQISSAIEEVAATSAQIATNSQELNAASASSSSSIEEVAASVAQIETNAQQTLDIAEAVQGDAETGQKAVAATREGINHVRQATEVSVKAMDSLNQQAENIDKIISVINEITEQTNLLALNAAIIAAQAGEQGRGFSVVAEEIRELAGRTSLSTREIADTVTQVHENVNTASQAIRTAEDRIVSGEELSEQSERALEKIVSGAQSVTGKMREVVRATTEQADGSKMQRRTVLEMAERIEQITKATEEQKRGNEQVAEATQQILDMIRRVSQATQEQNLSSKVVAQTAEEITRMVGQIEDAWQQQNSETKGIENNSQRILQQAEEGKATVDSLQQAIASLAAQTELLNREMGFFKTPENGRTT